MVEKDSFPLLYLLGINTLASLHLGHHSDGVALSPPLSLKPSAQGQREMGLAEEREVKWKVVAYYYKNLDRKGTLMCFMGECD